MSELYNRIDKLCKERGTNVTALCRDAKVARASLSELKAGRTKTLTLETGRKLAAVLGITVDELMGTETEKAPTPEGEREITMDDFTYAMQNESKDLTEADKRILLSMAKQLNDARKKRNGESD